jgi:hypothetical protein
MAVPCNPFEYPGERVLRGETVVPGTDFLHTSEDGVTTWIRVSSFPFRDAKSEVAGTLSVAQDISHEKRTEAQLRRFNETLEQRVVARTAEVPKRTRKCALRWTSAHAPSCACKRFNRSFSTRHG